MKKTILFLLLAAWGLVSTAQSYVIKADTVPMLPFAPMALTSTEVLYTVYFETVPSDQTMLQIAWDSCNHTGLVSVEYRVQKEYYAMLVYSSLGSWVILYTADFNRKIID